MDGLGHLTPLIPADRAPGNRPFARAIPASTCSHDLVERLLRRLGDSSGRTSLVTSKVDIPPSHIDTNEVLVTTRDHWWAHWSPQPMVEVEGSGVAALRNSRWAEVPVPRDGVRLTFFCWDLL